MSNSDQKLISAGLLGVIMGLWFHHSWSHQRLLGREAYLQHQGAHYDKFLSVPHSFPSTIFGGLFTVAIIVGAYELIAMIISKFFQKPQSGINSPQGIQQSS